MAESDNSKPHAIMVEFLFQGHIHPFIHLAIALASKGCTVTYVRTEFIHHLITKASAAQPDSDFSGARESGLDIRYTTVSDGFPPEFDRLLNFVEFYKSILHDFPTRVDDAVGKIVTSGELRQVPFIIADAGYLWPPPIAAKYNIGYVSFWSQSGLRLATGYHLELLKENGLMSDYGDYKDNIHGDIVGVNSTNVRDFIAHTPPENDPYAPPILKESVMKSHLEVRKADFILCHTVQELESNTMLALNQKLPTYAIGPTYFLAKNPYQKIPIMSSLRSEADCAEWLDGKPSGSVLLVAFGSLEWISKRVVSEIAEGLRMSRVNFVWILRHDLPNGYEDDIRGRGLIVPWCNQRDVLSTPAVGGFLTHCGWNSVMESVWFGVPMICYPIFMDQHTNRNLVVDDWKIGVNLCDDPQISKEEVAEKIDSLMIRAALDDVKTEVKKVSGVMRNAMAMNGSSDRNLDSFLQHLKEKMASSKH